MPSKITWVYWRYFGQLTTRQNPADDLLFLGTLILPAAGPVQEPCLLHVFDHNNAGEHHKKNLTILSLMRRPFSSVSSSFLRAAFMSSFDANSTTLHRKNSKAMLTLCTTTEQAMKTTCAPWHTGHVQVTKNSLTVQILQEFEQASLTTMIVGSHYSARNWILFRFKLEHMNFSVDLAGLDTATNSSSCNKKTSGCFQIVTRLYLNVIPRQ